MSQNTPIANMGSVCASQDIKMLSRKHEVLPCKWKESIHCPSVDKVGELIHLTGEKIAPKIMVPKSIHLVLFKFPLCIAETARAMKSELARSKNVLKEVSSMSKISRTSSAFPPTVAEILR